MKSKFVGVLIVGLAIAAFVLNASAYVVKEGTQAIITQFGKPVNAATPARGRVALALPAALLLCFRAPSPEQGSC